MPGPNISLYCHLMEEVKRRSATVWSFISGESRTIYKATTIESMCLQIRKILELIALGSLVANKEEFARQNKKFQNLWNARLILKDIQRLNPSFYPHPIEEIPGPPLGVKSDWQEIKTGFLNKDKFVKVYEKCGKITHAENPYGSKIDLAYYEKNITVWMEEMKILLNSHTIRLINDENLYLIHMKEDQDDQVHGYTFAPVK